MFIVIVSRLFSFKQEFFRVSVKIQMIAEKAKKADNLTSCEVTFDLKFLNIVPEEGRIAESS